MTGAAYALASMRPRVFPAEDAQRAVRSRTADDASMRPRVFPAEDIHRRADHARGLLASMRPRVFPAEDVVVPAGLVVLPLVASMRPRVFPAEDGEVRPLTTGGVAASMRPRVFPAEDVYYERWPARHHEASMRPRVFPAEDVGAGDGPCTTRSCFNEAAGIPRGRRPERCNRRSARAPRFNEGRGYSPRKTSIS